MRTRQHLSHHYADLIGEGYLVVAKVLDSGEQIDDLPGYVFKAARRRMVSYLEAQRGHGDYAGNAGPSHLPGEIKRRSEVLDDLRACLTTT